MVNSMRMISVWRAHCREGTMSRAYYGDLDEDDLGEVNTLMRAQ